MRSLSVSSHVRLADRGGADVKVISEVSGLSSKPKRDQRSALPELCDVGWTAAEWVGILLTCCWTCWRRPGRLIILEERHSSGSISQTLARPQPHVHTPPFWGRPGRKNKSALHLAIPRAHFRGWSAFFSALSHRRQTWTRKLFLAILRYEGCSSHWGTVRVGKHEKMFVKFYSELIWN